MQRSQIVFTTKCSIVVSEAVFMGDEQLTIVTFGSLISSSSSGVLSSLFSSVGLPLSAIPLALEAMARDSQNGVMGSRKRDGDGTG